MKQVQLEMLSSGSESSSQQIAQSYWEHVRTDGGIKCIAFRGN